ncbi:tRNA 2'-phosphotransferase 1 [Vitis vinifera]|uniref:2'-phosphotransferase n=1 Tax=Vitis vinifera TaxID=29760 RepID=A0A438GXI0_VITVI|nr:tRNA 2'-phosphotransferase 1 [Vitis vinifera]
MASELNLNMRSDGYIRVQDLLKLNMKTFANIPLRSHTIDDIREIVESESLLKPILSLKKLLVCTFAYELFLCVHGSYKRNLESILESGLKRMKRLHVHFSCGLPMDGEVISGMRRDVNLLIFLDVRKALEDGMKLYISDNKVILTEGFDGVVPVKYFEKIESWPDRQTIPF